MQVKSKWPLYRLLKFGIHGSLSALSLKPAPIANQPLSKANLILVICLASGDIVARC
jgi:hypothetical protein